MKILKIKEYLESYDLNKGYGRVFKDEPHIAELRRFYEDEVEGVSGELTPREQLKLVKICLGKNTWNESASSNALDGLLKELGGINALKKLQENKQLSADNVVLVGQFKGAAAENLALLIGTLKGYTLDVPLANFVQNVHLPNLHEKLKDIASLKAEKILSKQTLLLVANSASPCAMASSILLLRQHDVSVEELGCLVSSCLMSSTYSILSLLASINPELIKANLPAICKLGQETLDFRVLLGELSSTKELITQSNIEACLNPKVLQATDWIRDMLSTFTEAKWSLIDNLPRLLESVVKQEHLKIGLAVEALKKIKLKPEHAQLILDTLYKSPQHHNSLTDAVITLSQMDALTDENLAIVIRTPQYADKVAEGIRILKKISMDDSENKTCLSKVPEYAVSVASLFKQLVKVKQFSRKTQELALKQPENAEVAAKIIRFLRLENMFLAKNLPSFEGGKINLCEELLTRNLMILEFSDLLSDMESAEILTAPNLGKLIQNSKFIRSIASACCCLNNNSRLSQENFDALFDDPRRAIEIALALQGSAKPAPDNTVQDTLDKGIEDYLRIRRAAILMAQGQRKDSLFKPVNINEKQLERYNELFKNRPIINSLELQKDEHKELLLKIAKMCGNGHLEPEAEQAIASDAFIEFKAR